MLFGPCSPSHCLKIRGCTDLLSCYPLLLIFGPAHTPFLLEAHSQLMGSTILRAMNWPVSMNPTAAMGALIHGPTGKSGVFEAQLIFAQPETQHVWSWTCYHPATLEGHQGQQATRDRSSPRTEEARFQLHHLSLDHTESEAKLTLDLLRSKNVFSSPNSHFAQIY